MAVYICSIAMAVLQRFNEQTFNERSFSVRPGSSANACYSITAPFADDATFLIYLESQPLVTFGGGAT